MNEEDFARIEAMAKITRARMDVMERTLASFMVATNRPVAMVMEDVLRSYIEHGVTSDDPREAEKLRLGDEAALRLADVVAQSLARPR